MGVGRELRPQFPIFASFPEPLHYLDNAATGQICAAAAEALWEFETAARANVKRGVYRLADQASAAFEAARSTMASYIGAPAPDEVVFTSGATSALNIAAHGLAERLSPGDEILVSVLEHHSNIVPWQLAAKARQAVVKAIPVTDDGRLDLDRLGGVLTDRTRVVSVTHVSNVTGAVTDLARLRAAADDVGAILVVDGAQRAPHGPIDVKAIGADLYAFSAHKMFGATGAGVLWGRSAILDAFPPLLGGGEMIREVSFAGTTFAAPPHRFEAGTPPIGPVLAMAAAAEWLMAQDWSALAAHEARLTGRLLDGLGSLPGVRILGPTGLQQRLGVVAFEVDGVHAHDVCQLVDQLAGVALRGGHHCCQPLMERFDTIATARASLAPYNDDDDIDALIDGLERTIEMLQ
ncbi:MAG: aminotransferase class V-fold PLP-dependent enzyme [Geminicoccaceae bacterium]|nr:aminotransferase class V-fold PLP-dependent enzyme [Geminicoccaceae bacterium]